MNVESLACDNCSAPLDVPETANYVRCNHCGSQLAVHRETSVSYTETLRKVADRTERLADEVARLAYQNELARIDREWDREREGHMISDKHGNRREPSMLAAIFGAVVAGIIGVIATASIGPFGLVFLLFAVGIGVFGYTKAAAFEQARRRYRRRRRSVSLDQFRRRIDAGELPSDPDRETTAMRYLERLEAE